MSTHSRIAVEFSDGTIHSIYCHHDGYVSGGVGEILYRNYNNINDASKLMALGDLSALGYTTNHTPKDWQGNYIYPIRCLTYKDRGESNVSEEVDESFDKYYEALKNGLAEEYNYIYKDGNWFIINLDSNETNCTLSLLKNYLTDSKEG